MIRISTNAVVASYVNIVEVLKVGLNYNIYVAASNKEGDSLPSNTLGNTSRGKQLPDTGRKHGGDESIKDDSLQEYKELLKELRVIKKNG